MNAAQRREKILQQLHGASAPISASALALMGALAPWSCCKIFSRRCAAFIVVPPVSIFPYYNSA